MTKYRQVALDVYKSDAYLIMSVWECVQGLRMRVI